MVLWFQLCFTLSGGHNRVQVLADYTDTMIKNQVLIVGPPRSSKITLVKEILAVPQRTIDEVLGDQESHSGLTFTDIKITNKYYDTTINVWVDEFDDHSIQSMSSWCGEFLSEEYREIRDVVQGIIFTVGRGSDETYINELCKQLDSISEIFDTEFLESQDDSSEGFQWPGFKLVVVGNPVPDTLPNEKELEAENNWLQVFEDKTLMASFDFVDYNSSQVSNDYGEKLGKQRISEIFMSNEWKSIDKRLSSSETKSKEKSSTSASELLKPLLGNKESSEGKEEQAGSELGIEELDRVISKLKKAKLDVSNLTTSEEKEKYVNNIVNDIMKQL